MNKNNSTEKDEFIERMKAKTKKFAIDVTHLCDTLPPSQSIRTISFQLIKSAPPTGPNCRAACRARSKAEFYSKLCITVEEADESQYWLYSKRSGFGGVRRPNHFVSGIEVIEGSKIKCDMPELKRLLSEVEEILKVVSTARKNSSSG